MIGKKKEKAPTTLLSMGAIRLSGSGQVSVALKDLVKTDRYKEDLASLKRIAAAAGKRPS